MINYNLGDVIVATEKIWSKDLGKTIKKGTTMVVTSLDDIIVLPSPEKWIKQNEKI